MDIRTMLESLQNKSFEALFLNGEAERLLHIENAQAMLRAIIRTAEIEPALRVLAQEVLIEAGSKAEPEMAETYCRTMPDSFLHNWWGMPGQYTERLGRSLIAFGDAALPCLFNMLDNRRPLGYFGSEEPTLNATMQYRICDLASYFITCILNIPYQDSESPVLRDEFNQKLIERRNMSIEGEGADKAINAQNSIK